SEVFAEVRRADGTDLLGIDGGDRRRGRERVSRDPRAGDEHLLDGLVRLLRRADGCGQRGETGERATVPIPGPRARSSLEYGGMARHLASPAKCVPPFPGHRQSLSGPESCTVPGSIRDTSCVREKITSSVPTNVAAGPPAPPETLAAGRRQDC